MDHASIAKVAEAMISVLGSSAVVEARQKAIEAVDRGDLGAFRAWHSIMQAARSAIGGNNPPQP